MGQEKGTDERKKKRPHGERKKNPRTLIPREVSQASPVERGQEREEKGFKQEPFWRKPGPKPKARP